MITLLRYTRAMKTFIALLMLTAFAYAQPAAKPTTDTKSKVQVPAIPDKDRADFLLIQRDWMTTQKNYEDAFKREPIVTSLESKAKALAAICQDAGATFDPSKVQCVETPLKPEQVKK